MRKCLGFFSLDDDVGAAAVPMLPDVFSHRSMCVVRCRCLYSAILFFVNEIRQMLLCWLNINADTAALQPSKKKKRCFIRINKFYKNIQTTKEEEDLKEF